MCGEKTPKEAEGVLRKGSPPRVRGKATSAPTTINALRITPACAGKRPPPIVKLDKEWDHPRVCGEKPGAVFQVKKEEGLPPRVRGKDRNRPRGKHWKRITPACAGKSFT